MPKKYQQEADAEADAPEPPKYLVRTTTDDFGNVRRCVRAEEDMMTTDHARLTPRVLRAAQDRAFEKEAMMGPTESTARFFKELDEMGGQGRVISRGRTVGFLGPGGSGWSGRNR